MTRVPDFIIVGAAKSGTTSLANYLAAHPFVEIVSDRLEFFGEYWNPAVGCMSMQEYLDKFANIPNHVMAGEKSVSYLYSQRAPHEIFRLNRQMKIFIILRDPVERAYSDYWHRRRTGVESLSFEDALVEEKKRIAAGARFELHYASYGLYFSKVARYIDIFGPENVHVIRFEDLRNNPAFVCKQCFDFLGVEEYENESFYPVYNRGGKGTNSRLVLFLFRMAQNKRIVMAVRQGLPSSLREKITSWMLSKIEAKKYPRMSSDMERKLRYFFLDDIVKLENLLGWDLSRWKP